MHSFLYYYLIFINCTAFVVYGADKAFAKLHSWRVPEIVLKFIFGVPLIFFLQVALISYFFYKG